jgi:hypothetical protein
MMIIMIIVLLEKKVITIIIKICIMVCFCDTSICYAFVIIKFPNYNKKKRLSFIVSYIRNIILQ